jgi:Arc/MetJ-type ribon-helix-helix transcriptional regulator
MSMTVRHEHSRLPQPAPASTTLFELGEAGSRLTGEPLYRAVRAATGADTRVFRAESKIPRPAALNVPPSAIPAWYRTGMSKQIAVRLPEDIVEFIDGLIKDGKADSRAIVVTRALERERRRAIAARDAAILVRAGRDADMDSLADHVAHAPLDLE